MYECVLYEYGSGIFNDQINVKKYRNDVNEKARIYFSKDDVYENKKIKKI
jgi:hypothetical protein